MLWPFARWCSTLHYPGLVFFSQAQRHPTVLPMFKGIFWPFTILSLDCVFKLDLEVGNDEYNPSFCVTRVVVAWAVFKLWDEWFFKSRKPNNLYIWSVWIGLKNFVVNCHYEDESELENGKIIEGSLHSFYLIFLFFVNALPLLFPLEKWLNPVHTGLCFASCDREALRRSPSITSEPLMLVGHQKYYLIIQIRCLSSP